MKLIALILIASLNGRWHTLADADMIYRILPSGNPQTADTIILATSGGVVYFDISARQVVERYTNTEGLLGVVVTDVEMDSSGAVWALSRGRGLSFRLPGDQEFTSYPPSMFPASVGALDLEVAADNIILVATASGLYLFDTRGTYDNFEDDIQIEISRQRGYPFNSDSIVSVSFYSDTVYVATPQSVYFADYDSVSYFDAWHEIPMSGTGIDDQELTFVYRSRHYLLIGSDRGFWVQTPDTARPYFADASCWARLNDGIEGPDSNLYVATQRRDWTYHGGGVWRIGFDGDAEPLGILARDSISNFIWGLFSTAIAYVNGELIAGFGWNPMVNNDKYGAGLCFYDEERDSWEKYHLGLLWFNSPAFLFSYKDVVWILMRGGGTYPAYILGIAPDTIYVQDPLYRIKSAFSYAIDSRGFIWAGIYSTSYVPDTMQGILVFDSVAKFVGRIPATSLPIMDMTFSRGDTLYLCILQYGTYKLWAEFDGDSILNFTMEPVDVDVQDPVDIEVDLKNRLWIGTQGRGVKIIDMNTSDSYWITESEGLPSNYINMFKADGDGMWVCTKEGLAYFQDGAEPRIYLQGEDVSAVAPAADGRLWVVTADRVVVLRPESGIIEDQFVPGVYSLPGYPNPNFKTEVIAVRDVQGDVWIGTTNGVGVFEPEAMRTFTTVPKPYVYPNPYERGMSGRYVTVVGVPVDAEVAVFTVSGEKLPVEILRRGSEAFIDARNLSPGLYIVVIAHGDEVRRAFLAVK